MMSFKIIAALVALLLISHSNTLTKAQESGNLGADGQPSLPGLPEESQSASDTSEGSGDSDDAPTQRFFFGTLFSSRVPCDFSTQAGSSCPSCNQRLVCTRRGGYLTTCRGLLRHCNSGRCSFRQSAECAASATTTIAPTTTGAATTTTGAAETTTGAAATTTQATATTTQATATTTAGGTG